jgi:hypothetical protein
VNRRSPLRAAGIAIVLLGILSVAVGALFLAMVAASRIGGWWGEAGQINAISFLVIALWILPAGVVECVLAYPAIGGRAPGQAVIAALVAIVTGVALLQFSFAAVVAIPVLATIVTAAVAGAVAVGETRRRDTQPTGPRRPKDVVAAATALTILGVAALGLAVIFAVDAAIALATLGRPTNPTPNPGSVIRTLAVLIVISALELHLARRVRSGSTSAAALGGAVAILAGASIWIGSGRAAPDSIITIILGLIAIWPALNRRLVGQPPNRT